MRKPFGLVISVLLFRSILVLAQVASGTISGRVTDSTGAVISGAKVEILNEDTGVSRGIQTDATGRYSAPSLGLGKYQVTAGKEGFQTGVRKGIELTVGREAMVNLELSVGSVTQTVEVTGEAPLVESTTSAVSATVDERTITELPLNGRSYDQLALLQPGVVALGAGVGSSIADYGNGKRFSVTGSRSYANSFMLDGTDINDHANATPGGAAGNNMGVDAIREFKILTSPLSAEYGRSSGAIISSVTRSGTNQIHGTAFEFLRNNDLDARAFFDVGPVPAFRRNQFGGSFGGPIKKDKTFFFGAYEGLRQGQATTDIDYVPTLAAKQGVLPTGNVAISPLIQPFLALYPNPNSTIISPEYGEYSFAPITTANEDYFLTRVDHQVNDKIGIFGRYSFDNDSVVNPTNAGTSGSMPGFTDITHSRRQYSTIQMTDILNPQFLNNARFAFNRSYQTGDIQPTPALGPQYSFIPGQPIGYITVGGAGGFVQAVNPVSSLGTSQGSPRTFNYNMFQWGDDLTYVKGRHSLKFGVNVERIRDNANESSSTRGTYAFAGIPSLLAATPSSFQGVPVGESAYRGFRQTLMGAYGQDDFKVSPRLTLNLGLRWEAVTDPTSVNGMASSLLHYSDPAFTLTNNYISITKKNFDPRVGVAWQLNSKGTSVLRAGFAMFNDQILPQVYSINDAKIPPYFNILTATNPSFPNGYLQLNQTGTLTVLTDAPNMKTPTKIDYTMSFQQQLWKDSLVEVAYVGSESYHLVGYAEVNPRAPQILNGQYFFTATQPLMNPKFGSITAYETNSVSNYNALQVSFKRRSAAGLQYSVSYTYSKVLDLLSSIASADSQREPQVYMNPFVPGNNRGLASFNVAQNLLFTTSYLLPFRFGQKLVEGVLGGWEVSAIGTFQTGQPFTPRVGSNQSADGDPQNPDRPNLIPGQSNNPVIGSVNEYFNPQAFSLPAPGTFGNLGRNTIIGPGIAELDMALEKNFTVLREDRLQFRAEFFNIINHPNMGLPATQVFSSGAYNPTAGVITSIEGSAREIQFGLKFLF